MTKDEKEIVATIKLSLLRAIVDLNEETLAMAIRVPKSEEPSEDCVSRQAVLDYLHTNMAWYDENGSIADDNQKLRDITNLVNGIPSVTPTRKKGKWIFHEKSVSTGFKDLRECSCCRCYFRWEMPRNSYCPNCGAEMESEE